MEIYYTFAILELVLLGFSNFVNQNMPVRKYKLNVFDYMAIFFMVAFAGARYFTGSDYGRYLAIFTDGVGGYFWNNPLQWLSLTEPGYLLLNWLTAVVFPKWQFAIFWTAAILIYVPLFLKLKRRSSMAWLSIMCFILLGHFTMSFNIMKQYIAITFLFLSFDDFLDKKYLRFALLFIIAVSFHLSSLIYLPFLLVLKWFKPTYILLALCVCAGAIATALIPKILNMLPVLNAYLQFVDAPGTKIGAWIISGVWIATALLMLSFKDKLIAFNEHNRFYLCLFLFSLIFMVGGISNIIVARLVPPLQYGLFYLIPDTVCIVDKRLRSFTIYVVICLLLVWYGFYAASYGKVVPYQTYLIK